MATRETELRELERGLDELELAPAPTRTRLARLWAATWPKAAAAGLAVLVWQLVVWSGWKPDFLLPGPADVFPMLVERFGDLLEAAGRTLQRAVLGFGLALLIGTVLGALVARIGVLRAAIGSMITGLQTMPSIAWFPLAILLFQISEGAIAFVVVLGAAPSIANGLLNGIDHIPPLLLRTGRVLGARGFAAFRHVVLPAALPSFFGGIKQGWAFAWRSLLAGELLVFIPGTFSLGQQLQVAQDFTNARYMISVMIVIFVIGIAVDALVFGRIERMIRRRYGLVDEAAT